MPTTRPLSGHGVMVHGSEDRIRSHRRTDHGHRGKMALDGAWIAVAVLLLFTGCSTTSGKDGGGQEDGADGVPMVASELNSFSSMLEMQKASDAVIVATVSSVDEGRILDDSGIAGEDALQILDVSLFVDEVIAGTLPSEEVVIEWMGWELDGVSGEPDPPFIVNGIPTPSVSQRGVWFVREENGQRDGKPRYGLVSLDGMLHLGEDGRLTSPLADRARLGHSVDGETVSELERLLSPGRA